VTRRFVPTRGFGVLGSPLGRRQHDPTPQRRCLRVRRSWSPPLEQLPPARASGHELRTPRCGCLRSSSRRRSSPHRRTCLRA